MSTPEDRERTRRELQELANLAKPSAADSSGYVDLSAYSSRDASWVETALAKSRGGEAAPATSGQQLEAGSMGPVEMSALLGDGGARAAARKRRALAIVGAVTFACLALLTIAVARHGGSAPEPVHAAVANAAPAPAPPPVAAPLPQDIPPQPPAAEEAPSALAVAAVATPARATPAARATLKQSARPRPATKRPPAHAAANALARSKPSSGGDSLMAAMQQSFAGGAKH